MVRKVILTVVVLTLLVWSVPATLAQSPGTKQNQAVITVSNVSYDFNGAPWICLSYSLEVVGMAEQQLHVSLFPYYVSNGEFILSASGDPLFTTAGGYITDQFDLEVPFDDSIWDASQDQGVFSCTSDVFMPLEPSEYEFGFWLEFSDQNGEVIATYDSVPDLGAITYTVPEQVVRVSNIQYDFAATQNGEDGIMMYFSFEALGYADHVLRLESYPVNVETDQYLVSAVTNSLFTFEDGRLGSFDEITIPFDHSIWVDWFEDSASFHLFFPYSHFPTGNYTWYPELVVADAGEQVLLLDVFGEQSSFVEMNPSDGTENRLAPLLIPDDAGGSTPFVLPVITEPVGR